ncbi:MAG: fimbria/pilus periplasmic chaperone [Pleomorphochaeta sp.]
MKENFKKILLLLSILTVFISADIFAFQFSPLEQTFSPTGAGNTKTYTIVNDSNDSIAVEITALTRSQDAQGVEINSPATQYFSIVPNKTIVKPQSSQLIRVQYRGPQTTTSELSFRIRAEQVPYSQGRNTEDNSMFNFLYVYTTSAYVEPSQVVERVAIRRVAPSYQIVEKTDDNGNVTREQQETMAVTLSNLGTVHQLLIDATLIVQDSKGNTVKLSGEKQLAGLTGTNILARKTVTLQIPWPSELSREDGVSYKSNFDYE